MKRGPKLYGSNSIDSALGYLHGRIEKELEQFAIATGTPFAVVAQRISELLHPLGQGFTSEVSHMRSITAGNGAAVAALEVVDYSRDHEAPPDGTGKVQNNRGQGSGAKAYWARMTPEERAKEMQRRARLSAKRGGKMIGAKKLGRPKTHKRPSDDPEVRKYYHARYRAKQKGLPLPPLPSELKAS